MRSRSDRGATESPKAEIRRPNSENVTIRALFRVSDFFRPSDLAEAAPLRFDLDEHLPHWTLREPLERFRQLIKWENPVH